MVTKKTKKKFKVIGMTCNSCVTRIEQELSEHDINAIVDLDSETAEITYDKNKHSENDIKDIVKKAGYELAEYKENAKPNLKITTNHIAWLIVIAGILLLVYFLYQYLSGIGLEIPEISDNTSLFLLFIIGILTGFHCISMCGGFVVSYTAKNAINGHKSYKQHFVYGGSKVISYAIIGGIFGLLGGIFAFSVLLRGYIAIFAGMFMIFYALSMFGFKIFRVFQFNPKFLTKFTVSASKHAKGPYKAPFITGMLSGLFIACGPLQAMYLFAMGSGSFTNGFTSLAVFGLGTIPIMIGFGSMATVISHNTTKKILKFSAIIVLILGIVVLNRGLTVLGSPVSYDVIKEKVTGTTTGNVILKDGKQVIDMEVNRYGWEPNSFVLKKGVPVKWNINVKELTGCNNEIIVNEYDLDIKLKKGLNVVEFTPDKIGTVRWSCWMGMIPGSFLVTEDGAATTEQIKTSTPESTGGSCGGSCGSPTCGAASGGSCGCGG